MSPDEHLPVGGGEPNAEPALPVRTPASGPPAKKRSLMFHMGRGMAWLVGGVLALLILLVGGFWWYTTTDDFQRRVGEGIVSGVGEAAGGGGGMGGGEVRPVD